MRTVEKALRLLDHFNDQNPEFGLSELAKLSGIDKATVLRMLSDLVIHQINEGTIHPYSTYHYEMIEAFRRGDAEVAAALMVKDIEATQALLQDMCPI